jgi:hypothetical protein
MDAGYTNLAAPHVFTADAAPNKFVTVTQVMPGAAPYQSPSTFQYSRKPQQQPVAQMNAPASFMRPMQQQQPMVFQPQAQPQFQPQPQRVMEHTTGRVVYPGVAPPPRVDFAPSPHGLVRDWEGLAHARNARAEMARAQWMPEARLVQREGPTAVATLAESSARANFALDHPEAALRVVQTPGAAAATTRGGYADASGLVASPHARTFVDHQTYLAWKRQEYQRHLEAEAAGEVFVPRPFPGTEAPGAAQMPLPSERGVQFRDPVNAQPAGSEADQMDEEEETDEEEQELAAQWQGREPPREAVARAVEARVRRQQRNAHIKSLNGFLKDARLVGTADEIAWLHPPQVPPPQGWNGYWDLCAGHELLLQLMRVSGATPTNSPTLTKHFMYAELLSCVQRMQYGNYLVFFDRRGESPHERWFYIKSLPLASSAQLCPFLCWAKHRTAHNAIDAIPLTNVMWVTPGVHTERFKRWRIGNSDGARYLHGPFVGKSRANILVYGAFTVWVYDGGKRVRGIDVVATDPLAFTMWMKLLDDVAQLNAALDTTGCVRAVQQYIEELKVAKQLAELDPPKPSILERIYAKILPEDRPWV